MYHYFNERDGFDQTGLLTARKMIFDDSVLSNSETLGASLVAHLCDSFDAERQLLRDLLKMATANPIHPPQALETHLSETEEQVSKLKEILTNLDSTPGKKEELLADLAQIAEANKAEHSDDTSCITARDLAVQLRMP